MSELSFFIPGIPVPGGSKRAFSLRNRDGSIRMRPTGAPMIVVTDTSGARGKTWRSDVKAFAGQAHAGPPLSGPLRLSVVFHMPRPGAHFGTRKGERYLKESAPHWHTNKPDRTKLLRALEDALTGILWDDDTQVVDGPTTKVYSDRPGAVVKVEAANL